MRLVTSLYILLFATCLLNIANAQGDINNENFTYTFGNGANGAQVIYNGKSHAFSFDIPGKKVKEQLVDGKQPNQVFLDADTNVIQISLIPLPQPIPAAMQLSNLTADEAKQTLEGYVNYELDYMEKDLKVNPHNVKKEWKTINSKLVLVWYFEFDSNAKITGKTITAQAYYSSICFNQVVDLNMPLYLPADAIAANAMLNSIQLSLKTYNMQLNDK